MKLEITRTWPSHRTVSCIYNNLCHETEQPYESTQLDHKIFFSPSELETRVAGRNDMIYFWPSELESTVVVAGHNELTHSAVVVFALE